MATILVSDDDPDLREALGEVLRAEGYDVVEAPNGARALELALSAAPDLVVLDHVMPLLSGAEVRAELRVRAPGLPVILLTGAAELEGLRDAEGARVFAKPLILETLLAEVRALLSGGVRE